MFRLLVFAKSTILITMENETPEEMLKREISMLMQRYGITPNRVYELLNEMEEFYVECLDYEDAF